MKEEDSVYTIIYPNGCTDNSAYVKPLGNDRYQLLQDPLSSMFAESEDELETLPKFMDVIFAEKVGEKKIRYIKVSESSEFNIFDYIITERMSEHSGLKDVLEKVENEGGQSERVLGGILKIFLPLDSVYDPSEDLDKLGKR